MDDKIFITDDNGNEREMNILFTFDMNDENYVVVYEESKDDELFSKNSHARILGTTINETV